MKAFEEAGSQQERDLITDRYLLINADDSGKNIKNRYEYPYLTARNYEYRQQREVYIIDDGRHDFDSGGQVYITCKSENNPDC